MKMTLKVTAKNKNQAPQSSSFVVNNRAHLRSIMSENFERFADVSDHVWFDKMVDDLADYGIGQSSTYVFHLEGN